MDKIVLIPILKKGKKFDCNINHVFNLLDAQPENYKLTDAYQRKGDEIFDTSGNLIARKVQSKSLKAELPFGLKLDGNKIYTPTGQVLVDLYEKFGRFQVDKSSSVEVDQNVIQKLNPNTDHLTKGKEAPPPDGSQGKSPVLTDEQIEEMKAKKAKETEEHLNKLTGDQLDEYVTRLKIPELTELYNKKAKKAEKVQLILAYVG